MISVVKVGKSREMRAILRVEISRKGLFVLYTRLKYHTLVLCFHFVRNYCFFSDKTDFEDAMGYYFNTIN